MDRKRLEIVVGVFVTIGVVLFCFFIFFIGGVYLFKPGYHLNVKFTFVSGISKGASIRYAGVPVGEVVSLDTVYDDKGRPNVLVKIWIKEGVIVREDSQIEIRGAFALSEAHMEIITLGKEDGKVLRDGDYIRGIDPVPLDNLIREGEEITRVMKHTLVNIDNIISNQETQRAVKQVILNMEALTAKLNDILYSSEANIEEILTNAEKSLTDLQAIIQDAKGLVATLEEKEGTVGKLLYDDEMYNEMMEFINDIKRHPWKLLKKTKEKDEKKGLLF